MITILDRFKNGEFADPARPMGALVYAAVFALLAWLFGRALRLAVHRVLARDEHGYVDRTAVNFLAQLAQIGVWLFAFISYAHLVPALSRLGTAWLASVGVASVVLGLAAQNTLGNLIAGISLLLYRPFKVGDRLQVTAPTGLETGVVESLNLGYTVLKTDDNRRVVVPNSTIASQTTINLTCEDPRALCSVPISISCDSDIDKTRAILLELARRHPKAQEVTGCPVTQFGPNGVVLTLGAWCADSATASVLKGDLLEQAAKRLAAEGIKLPSSQTTVTLIHADTPPPASSGVS
ncbi:MAG TPA: mechanosensitive ion channel family protein [Desulfobaccales bacterium]